MGTTRNNFAAVFLPLVLMLSIGRSLPHGHETSSRRNSIAEALNHDARSSLNTIHECLYVDPDLPICDVNRMLKSNEGVEETSDENFADDAAARSRRNADVSATTRVVVYTIEGCLPPRLPFSLPPCKGIPLDRIVDVRIFRPFAVEGVTRPPFLFPEFNYDRWLRMMRRLRGRVSSKTEDEQHLTDVPAETMVDEPFHDSEEQLVEASTTQRTMPNPNTNASNGSLLNGLVSIGRSNTAESTNKQRTIIGHVFPSNSERIWQNESQDSSASTSIENTDPSPSFRSPNGRGGEMETSSRRIHDRSTVNVLEKGEKQRDTIAEARNLLAMERSRITPISHSFYEQPRFEDPSNELATRDDFRSYRRSLVDTWTEENDNRIATQSNDLSSSELRSFRRRREIDSSVKVSRKVISEAGRINAIDDRSFVERVTRKEEPLSSRWNGIRIPAKRIRRVRCSRIEKRLNDRILPTTSIWPAAERTNC